MGYNDIILYVKNKQSLIYYSQFIARYHLKINSVKLPTNKNIPMDVYD